MKQRRPTQTDVARRAGVSAAVVSKVLNPESGGTVRVGTDTQNRVLEAMEELGYVPNPVARNLARGRTRLLGVFSFESIFPVAQENFYFPFLRGIEQEAEARGYDLLLFTSASREGRPRSLFVRGANRLQMADGGLLLGRRPPKDELARLASSGYPFVCIGRREVPGAEVSYVAADYAGATRELTRHLADLGHVSIAYIGQLETDESASDREVGYRSAMNELGRGELIRVVRSEPSSLDAARITDLLHAGVTAALMETDDMALSFISLVRAQGWRTPRDVSFAVLGDPLNPATEAPEWTMFRIPREAMGRTSLDALLTLLDHPSAEPRRVVLPCTLVPGNSTAPPPTHSPTGLGKEGR